MSYIAFELDALNVARDVGAAAGIPEERVTHGLLRMWAWCFREKTEHVTVTHVQGFFGTDCAPALQAFGFLARAEGFECAEEINFRVRGAERYLRVSEARKKGAEKTNAAKKERTASVTGATLERRSSDAGATLNRTLPDALTPNTEHRAPNTIQEEAPQPPKQPGIVAFHVEPPDPQRIESWTAQDFWRAFELDRRELGYPPQKWPNPNSLRDWWQEARPAFDVTVLGMAAQAYCRRKYWIEEATPSCPWAGFAKHWNEFIPRKAVAS